MAKHWVRCDAEYRGHELCMIDVFVEAIPKHSMYSISDLGRRMGLIAVKVNRTRLHSALGR